MIRLPVRLLLLGMLTAWATSASGGAQRSGTFYVLSGRWAGQQVRASATGLVDPYRNRELALEGWVEPPARAGDSWALHSVEGTSVAVRPVEELSPAARALAQATTLLHQISRNLELRPGTAGGPGIAALCHQAQERLAWAGFALEAEQTGEGLPIPTSASTQLHALSGEAQEEADRAGGPSAPTAGGAAERAAALSGAAFELLVDIQSNGQPVLEPAAVDFGDVKVGAASAPKVVTFKNNSKSPVELQELSVYRKGPFSGTPVGKTTVAPGGTVQISVTFIPANPGEERGNVQADLGKGKQALYQTLSGRGVGDFSLPRQTVIDFGEVKVGQVADREMVITNHTNRIITVQLGDRRPKSAFSVLNSAQVQLPANGSATVTLRFTPLGAEPYRTTITAQDVATPKGPLQKMRLVGRGKEDTALEADPSELIIDTSPGEPVTENITLWNTTKEPIAGMIDRSKVSKTYFTFLGDPSFNIAPQGSYTFSVFFLATGKCTHRSKAFFVYNNVRQAFPISAVSR